LHLRGQGARKSLAAFVPAQKRIRRGGEFSKSAPADFENSLSRPDEFVYGLKRMRPDISEELGLASASGEQTDSFRQQTDSFQ